MFLVILTILFVMLILLILWANGILFAPPQDDDNDDEISTELNIPTNVDAKYCDERDICT